MTQPPVDRYVDRLSARSTAIVWAGFLLFVLALLVARRLQLRSDFSELLPQEDPELKQLKQIGERVGGASNLIVAVEGPDPNANERFADALVARLKGLIGTDLSAIDVRADEARSFYEHNRALYADLTDLRRADDDLRKLIVSAKNPAFVPFADEDFKEDADDPRVDLRHLQRDLDHRRSAERFPHGYFESPDRKLLAIVNWTRSTGIGDASSFDIRNDVLRLIAAVDPARFGPVTARITGDVPSAIEEHDALKADIEWVSGVCTALVILVIVVYYRSALSLIYLFFPTLLGVAVAFGITALTIGYLNTNTAFLGSIILGNGINFGIILLARLREERTRAPMAPLERALAVAIRQTYRPTLVAALCAAVAYGSLTLTRFRGFRQFGEIGGLGMALCWLATYSYGPALICFVERLARRRTLARALPIRGAVRASGWLLARPRPVLVVAGLLTLISLGALSRVVRNPVEYDFSKLRSQRSRKGGVGELYGRVGKIFPQDLAPIGVALMPSAADASAYRRGLLAKDCADGLARAPDPIAADPGRLAAECARRAAAGEATGGLFSAVATAEDSLPRDQDAKLAVIDDIRRWLRDPGFQTLSPDDRQRIQTWTPPDDLRRLTLADLPPSLVRRFRERDGTVGRVALLYPVRVWANWDGHNLIRLSGVMKNVRLPNGDAIDAAGSSSLFAAMLRSMAADGPLATGAAFAGVVLLVLLLFRNGRAVALVLTSLIVGVAWMGGAAAVMGLKLNFLNFVALPVTLGIGVDYAVNVLARLDVEPRHGWSRALAETGSAVALCSSTTIIGYSSLLIASNGALRSFGILADLGEIGCLVAALLLVPAISALRPRAGS